MKKLTQKKSLSNELSEEEVEKRVREFIGKLEGYSYVIAVGKDGKKTHIALTGNGAMLSYLTDEVKAGAMLSYLTDEVKAHLYYVNGRE